MIKKCNYCNTQAFIELEEKETGSKDVVCLEHLKEKYPDEYKYAFER
jgi:hypothetical protein